MSVRLKATGHGFEFGPALVEALSSIEWRPGRGEHVVVGVKTPFRDLNIYVSPTGRSVRVFYGHKEMKVDEA